MALKPKETIEEGSKVGPIVSAWNNAKLFLTESSMILSIISVASLLAITIVQGGLVPFLIITTSAFAIFVAGGTLLKRSGFFYRVLNALFDSQTRPLWINQTDYTAARYAYYSRFSDEELREIIKGCEERLGVTRKTNYEIPTEGSDR
jgi:hypothetical protein